MKIAIIYPSLRSVGGAENVVVWLAESLVQRDHEVVLFTKEYSETEWGKIKERPYTVHLLDFKKYRSTLKTNRAAGVALEKALSSYAFDIVNPHNYQASLWVYYAKQQQKEFPRVVLFLHNLTRNFYSKIIDVHYRRLPGLRNKWDRHRPKMLFRKLRQLIFRYRQLDRAAVLSSDLVLANSAYTAQMVEKIYGIDARTCSLGVSPERFARHMANMPDTVLQTRNTFSILAVARIEFQKNFDTLLKAIRIVKDNNVVPEGFTLKVAGDGPHITYFKKKCRKMRIDDTVEFLGSVPHKDIGKLYSDADFIVHIPLDEPFGLVPIEAALFKKPSIVSDHGGPSEIVVNGITGLHVDGLDEQRVANTIVTLLQQPERIKEMGDRAYSRVMQNMTWEIFAGNYEKNLQDAVSAKSLPSLPFSMRGDSS